MTTNVCALIRDGRRDRSGAVKLVGGKEGLCWRKHALSFPLQRSPQLLSDRIYSTARDGSLTLPLSFGISLLPSFLLDELPHLASPWGDVFMVIWGMPENWVSRAVLLCMLTSCRTYCQRVHLTLASRLPCPFSSWPTQRPTAVACTCFSVCPSGGDLQGRLVSWALLMIPTDNNVKSHCGTSVVLVLFLYDIFIFFSLEFLLAFHIYLSLRMKQM